MWKRKEIKQQAKDALQRNYWKIVLVAALAAILSGGLGASGSSVSGSVNTVVSTDTTTAGGVSAAVIGHTTVDEEKDEQRVAIVTDEEDSDIIVFSHSLEEAKEEVGETTVAVYMVVIAIMVICIILIVFAVTFAVGVLLFNPFRVGVQRFMLKSVDDKAEAKEVFYAFDHSYKNVVRTMFHQDIQILLWSLLFVIPGIYKSYQYRMVSYILAEHPDMDYRQVLQMSKDIMQGEKWHAFVLDLSFILWHMLGAITCGIVELFYVNPYIWLTDAALYRKLCELHHNPQQAALTTGSYTEV